MATTAASETVTGVAVYPGRPHSVHLTELPAPRPGPEEVLVRVRRVGVCGTDREIIEAKFGTPPPGSENLVLGHEVLGVVEEVGERVAGFAPGDLVTATVRRPDGCPACQAGQPDMCVWRQYAERGILFAHGFMVERFVERPEHLIPIPPELEAVGVLAEPLSVVEKAYRQAVLIQRRIAGWEPRTAVVLGAGPIGLLGTLILRERGMDVWTMARSPAPTAASALLEAAGATYVSTRQTSLAELAPTLPNIDLVIEATGSAPLSFEAMDALGNNGVLVLLAIVGSAGVAPVPVDSIVRGMVLGNKVAVGSVNSAKEDFAAGVARMGRFEALWPGLLPRLITARLAGFAEADRVAEAATGGVKTVVELGG